MLAAQFQRIVSGFVDANGDTCMIRVTRESVMFSTFGDEGRCTKSFGVNHDDSNGVAVRDEFSFRTLKTFATTASLAKTHATNVYQFPTGTTI
jgi:hypothetical protein